MADYVVTQRYQLDDQVSAKAQAMADSLNAAADAADRVETTVTKGGSGASASSLTNRYDAASKAATVYDKALRDLAAGSATMDAAVAAGSKTQEQRNAVVQALAARVTAAKAAVDALAGASGSATEAALKMAAGHTAVAEAAQLAEHGTAGLYRELLVLAHESVTGRFNRIPGSLMVLAERSGNLEGIVSGVGAAITSTAGMIAIGAAASAAALVAMAVSAEDAALRVAGLQNQLRATRADFQTLGATGYTGAEQFAATHGVSGSDALAATQTLIAQPLFSGSNADLQAELALSQNLALVWNTSLPDAAKRLAQALVDPMAAAEALAKDGLPSMTEATLQSIHALQQQGDYIGADRVLLDAYKEAADGAAQNLTPLGQAVHDVSEAFSELAHTAGPALNWLGGALVRAVAQPLMMISKVLEGIDKISEMAAQHDALGSQAAINPYAPGYRSPMQHLNDTLGRLHPGIDMGGMPLSALSGQDSGAAAQQIAAQNMKIMMDADKLSAGAAAARTEVLRNENIELQKAAALAEAAGLATDRYTQQIQKNRDEIGNLAQAHDKHAQELNKLISQTDNAATSNVELAAAYGDGYAAVAKTTAETKAYGEAIRLWGADAKDHQAAIADLVSAYQYLGSTAGDVKLAQQNLQSKDTLDYLQAETGSLGMDATARAVMLAGMKAEQQARAENAGQLDAEGEQYVENAEAIAQATAAYQAQQQAISSLDSLTQQAFDQIGQAIANAFVSGQGHAVSFRNVFHAMIASILTDVTQLAVINPVLNDLLGGNRATLSTTLSAIGAGGGGGSIMGDLGSAGSFLNLGGIGDTLGLTGSGGLLSTTLWSSGTAGAVLPEQITAATGSVSLGGLLGGAGAGFAAGSLLNQMIGGNTMDGTIGSGVGALAGAAIGSIVPGIGTLIGGLIGGAAGGGLGGLFGPGKPHHGWNIGFGTDSNGLLQITGSGADKTDITQQLQQALSQEVALNQVLGAYGIQVSPTSFQIGANNAGPMAASLAQLFPTLGFGAANDNTLNTDLQGRSFASTQDLATFAAFVTQTLPQLTDNSGSLQKQIDSLNTTYGKAIATAQQYGMATDALTSAQQAAVAQAQDAQAFQTSQTLDQYWAKALSATAGSVGSAMPEFQVNADLQRTQLSQQLIAAYGEAYTATSDYARVMAALNASLAAQQVQTEQQVQATEAGVDATWKQIIAKGAAANGDTQWAALVNFDVSADQERQQLTQQLTAAYGESIVGTTTYNQIMGDLNTSLAAQRAVIADQPTETGAQGATSVFSSLASYVQGLRTGSDNPAGPLGAWQDAQSLWATISAGALGGNVIDLQQLQSTASAYLSDAKTVFGSGQGYVGAFNNVLDVLGKVTALPQDTLTASFYADTQTKNTDRMVQAIADLQTQVTGLRADLKQSNATPARVAA